MRISQNICRKFIRSRAHTCLQNYGVVTDGVIEFLKGFASKSAHHADTAKGFTDAAIDAGAILTHTAKIGRGVPQSNRQRPSPPKPHAHQGNAPIDGHHDNDNHQQTDDG